jgi:very-short-patch-repair endonuclease
VQRAKKLRRDMTDAERKLWLRLNLRQLGGVKFRKQVPVDPYIADFACLEHLLIIELDGGQHDENRAKDEKRTRYLEAKGYRVLRFWNTDVMRNIDGVMEAIAREIGMKIECAGWDRVPIRCFTSPPVTHQPHLTAPSWGGDGIEAHSCRRTSRLKAEGDGNICSAASSLPTHPRISP